MFGFLKAKAAPADIGRLLAEWVEPAQDLDGPFLGMMPDDVDRGIARRELRYLRAFAIHFAVSRAFDGTPNELAILGAFHNQIALDAERGSGLALKELDERHARYVLAFQETNPNGPAYSAGKAFAEFCSAPGDLDVIMAGAGQLGTTFESLDGVLRSLKAKRSGGPSGG